MRPIINKIGKKHNISIGEGELILGSLFDSIYVAITDPRMPSKIQIPLFGYFKLSNRKINQSLRATIRFYKRGGLSYDYVKSRISRLWPIKNRLAKEKQNHYTYKEWKKKSVYDEMVMLVKNVKEKREKSKEVIFGEKPSFSDVHKKLKEIQKRKLKEKDGKN